MSTPATPPLRPAAPNRRPSCGCCHGKRSLAIPGNPIIYACPQCDYATDQRRGACFGPVHPG